MDFLTYPGTGALINNLWEQEETLALTSHSESPTSHINFLIYQVENAANDVMSNSEQVQSDETKGWDAFHSYLLCMWVFCWIFPQ